MTALAAIGLILIACGAPGARSTDGPTDPGDHGVDPPEEASPDPARSHAVAPSGPSLSLVAASGPDQPTQVAATPLDDTTTAKLRAHLPAPVAPTSAPTPAPLAGPAEPAGLVAAPAFVTEPSPAVLAVGPLTARGAPTGEVPRAQRISVTFDRAMEATPATARRIAALEPGTDGVWRWLGDRTLVFVPRTGVLPMATSYKVVIERGARAVDGSELQADYAWSFETARPRVVDVVPDDRAMQRRSTPIVLVFDQRVDPASALKAARLSAGGRAQPLRLATAADLAGFPDVAAAAAAAGPRAIALRPIAPLPDGEVATLTLAPGVAALEGPLRSTESQVYAIRTLPALALTRTRCGFGDACRPGDPWTLELDHPVDVGVFDPALVTVSPDLPDLDVTVAGRWITIKGRAHGRTRYTVTLAAGLRDVHGQRLARPASATFEVGAAPPTLSAPGGSLVVLPPGGPLALPVTTVNVDALRVTVRRVTPDDWPAWLAFSREAPRALTPLDPPGTLVATRVVPVRGAADTPVVTPIAVDDALSDGRGHAVVSVAPTAEPATWYQRQDLHRWVDATDLSVSVQADGREARAWVTELATGASVVAAEVRLGGALGDPVVAATGADGTATLSLDAVPREGRAWLVVRKGEDTAVVPDADTGLGGPSPWLRVAGAERARWLVLDGAATAAPGGRWRAHGWVRLVAPSGPGEVLAAPAAGARIPWAIIDARGRRVDHGVAELDATGGFSIDAQVSSRARAGQASLGLELEASDAILARHDHPLTLVEPEGAVAAPRLEVAPARLTGPGEVALTLRAGDAREAAAEAVRWRATAIPRPSPSLAPDGFSFSAPRSDDRREASATTHLDDAGVAHATLRVPAGLATPAAIAVEAAVDAASSPRVGRATVALGRDGDVVGIRLSRGWAIAGDEATVELVALGPGGRPRGDRVLTVRAVREGDAGDGDAVEVCERATAGVPVRCAWRPEPGIWRVVAADAAGEQAAASLVVVAVGGPAASALRLVPDQPVHAPGDTARVLVISPFAEASGVATVARDGVLLSQRFEVEGGLAELELPVAASWRPGVVVEAHVVARGGGDAGAHALARATFAVPPQDRALAVSLSVPAGTAPGSRVPVTARVLEASGAPVAGASVALIASPAAGAAPAVPDPMARFWGGRPSCVVNALGRDRLARTDAASAAELGPSLVTGEPEASVPRPPGALVGVGPPTGADGTTRLDWWAPEHEGGYRLDAVAVSGADRFGRGELDVSSRDAVSVEVRWPRALVVGDRLDVPVVVHNRGAAGATVALVAQGDGVELPAGAGWRVAVPGERSVTAALPVVARRSGTHRVAVAWETPASGRVRTLTGTLEIAAASRPRRRQADGEVPRSGAALVVPAADGPRRLTLRVAASRAVALGGAVAALSQRGDQDDPEALASRIIAWSALADVDRLAVAAGLAGGDAVRADIARDLLALQRLQGDDGGFSGWRRGAPSSPWVSIHAAHAIARAATAGVRPRGELLDRAKRYVAQIDRHLPRGCSAEARATILAYALYVRALLGDADVARAKAVVAAGESLDVEAVALLTAVVHRERAARGEARLLEELIDAWVDAGAVRLRQTPEDRAATLATPDRALALALDALVTRGAPAARTERLVAATLAARNPSGSFGGDEADAWAVVALSRAFAADERVRPDVTARAWLDGALRVDERIRTRGGAAPAVTATIPARAEARVGLARRGSGPLHYALVEEGEAPLAAVESGFVVSRRFVAVDDPGDVRRDGDGTWRLRLGARVRVLVTAVTTEGRGRVVLRAPTAPGFVVDPRTALADGERTRDARGPLWSFDGATRAQLPAVAAGPHVYSWVGRATVRGRVTIPGVELRLLSDRAVRGLSEPAVVRVE